MAKTNSNGHGGQSGIGSFTTISGSGQADRLFGTDGANYIDGRSGNDYLNGGAGNDTLTGGGGFDQFVLKSGGGQDVVTDYQPGEDIFFNFGYVTNNLGDPIHDGAPHALSAGEVFTTSEGHTLTVGVDAAGSTTLTWDTGDSLTLTGVDPGAVNSSVLCFYTTDLGWQL
jgi:hemolysin type calcium-binding protein